MLLFKDNYNKDDPIDSVQPQNKKKLININYYNGLFHLIAIHPHGRAIITSEGSKFMPF